MKKIFCCFLLLNFQQVNAQSIQWFEGSLVLSNCEVLVGKISVEQEHDLILFERHDSRMVYPAHAIKSFYFYDNVHDINRRFVSLKKDDAIRSAHHLYEVVISGEASVMRRKKTGSFSIDADTFGYNYFVRYNDALTPLKKFKRKIYPAMKANQVIAWKDLLRSTGYMLIFL